MVGLGSREFLEQSLLTEEEESGIRRLGFDDPDCLEGHEEPAEQHGHDASIIGISRPEDWWIAYATSDDEEGPIFPGDWDSFNQSELHLSMNTESDMMR